MNATERAGRARVWLRGLLGLFAATGVLLAQPRAEGERTVSGTVKSQTTAPKGEIDGAVLDDGTVIHWPPHLQERFRGLAAPGERVRVTGRTETGRKGDTRFEVTKLTNLRIKTSADNDEPPPRGPKGKEKGKGKDRRPEPLAAEMRTVSGTVKTQTTAPKGEIDGAVLDDGTVIHWPPHLQERFKDLAPRGERVKVTGWMETGHRGDTHLEVRSVTNLRSNVSRSRGDEGPPPPPAAAAPADREQRLRDLERQVEQLRREIERLRRE